MKKLSLLLVFALVLFACSKEKSFEAETTPPVDSTGGGGGTPPNTYFIQVKIDGVSKMFDVTPTAQTINNPMANLLGLGAFATTGEALGLSISSINGQPEAGKTYTSGATSMDYNVLGTYSIPNANTAFVAGAPGSSASDPLTITIATKTATEITGSFKGTFYKTSAQGTQTGESKRFTDGLFRLPMQ